MRHQRNWCAVTRLSMASSPFHSVPANWVRNSAPSQLRARGHVLRSIWSAPRIDLVSAADRSGQRRGSIWSAPPIDLVSAAIDEEIGASDLGRWIKQRAGQKGCRTLRRFAQTVQLNAQGRYDAQPMIVATTHSDDRHSMRTIDVTDHSLNVDLHGIISADTGLPADHEDSGPRARACDRSQPAVLGKLNSDESPGLERPPPGNRTPIG